MNTFLQYHAILITILILSVNSLLPECNRKFLSTITRSQYASVDISKIVGCWQVIETGNKDPSWKKYSNILGKLSNKTNRNFQYFSRKSNSFVNLSEYLGSSFYAYTNGHYEIVNKQKGVLAASVLSICIVFFFLRFQVNVNGKGKSPFSIP